MLLETVEYTDVKKKAAEQSEGEPNPDDFIIMPLKIHTCARESVKTRTRMHMHMHTHTDSRTHTDVATRRLNY